MSCDPSVASVCGAVTRILSTSTNDLHRTLRDIDERPHKKRGEVFARVIPWQTRRRSNPDLLTREEALSYTSRFFLQQARVQSENKLLLLADARRHARDTARAFGKRCVECGKLPAADTPARNLCDIDQVRANSNSSKGRCRARKPRDMFETENHAIYIALVSRKPSRWAIPPSLSPSPSLSCETRCVHLLLRLTTAADTLALCNFHQGPMLFLRVFRPLLLSFLGLPLLLAWTMMMAIHLFPPLLDDNSTLRRLCQNRCKYHAAKSETVQAMSFGFLLVWMAGQRKALLCNVSSVYASPCWYIMKSLPAK